MKDFSKYGELVTEAPQKQKVGAIAAAARGAIDLPTFGFSGELGANKLIGGLSALYARTMQPELFKDESFKQTATEGEALSKNIEQNALQDQPLAYIAGGLPGAAASSAALAKQFPRLFGLAPQSAGFLSRAKSLAKVGFLEGAISGAGSTEGDIIDRGTGALTSGAIGAVASPVMGEAARGVTKLAGKISGQGLSTGFKGTEAEKALAGQVYDRPDILANIEQAKGMQELALSKGIQLTPAEALDDESLMALQATIKGKPGVGAAMAQKLRQARQTEQLPAAFERQIQAISPVQSADEAGRMLINEAQQVERGVRNELSQQAKPFYDAAHQKFIPSNSAPLKNARVQDYLKQVRTEFPEYSELPDTSIQVLDEVKKMMDYDISSVTTGANKDFNRARLIRRAKDALLGVMDEAAPEYQQARRIYAEGAPEIEEIVSGRIGSIGKQTAIKEPQAPKQLITGSAEQTADIASRFNPEVVKAGAAGILRGEQQAVRGEAFDTIQKRVFNTPQQRQQFQSLLGNKYESFADLMDVMQRVGKGQRFLEGSPTQPRQEASNKLAELAQDALTNKSTFAEKVFRGFFGQSPEAKTAQEIAFYNDLADLMLTPRGLDVIEFVAEMKPTIEQAKKILGAVQRASGSTAARTSGQAQKDLMKLEKPQATNKPDFSQYGTPE